MLCPWTAVSVQKTYPAKTHPQPQGVEGICVLSGDDIEPFEGSRDGLLSGKVWAVLIVIIVSLAVVLSTVSYFVFFSVSEQTMTMTQLVDKMRDTDGDSFPDEYIPYDEGDNVTVRDQLIGYQYVGRNWSWLEFPYTGTKWKDIYGIIGYVSASVRTASSLCSYGQGDWVTLNGTVEVYEWNGNRTELMNWTLVGDTGPFELPSIELNLTQVSESTWRVTPSNCTTECRLWHFDFLLRKYTLGMDWIQQLEHGKRSIYMEFWDNDRDGCLSVGDVLYINPEEAGDYEVALLFHSDELYSVSWTFDGP